MDISQIVKEINIILANNHGDKIPEYSEKKKEENSINTERKIRLAVEVFRRSNFSLSDEEISFFINSESFYDTSIPRIGRSSVGNYLKDERIKEYYNEELYKTILEKRLEHLLEAKSKGGFSYAKKNAPIFDKGGKFIGSYKKSELPNAVKGYKAFQKGLKSIDGSSLELHIPYEVKGPVEWRKNGFHFCEHFEETLRYFDLSEGIEICEVTGYGNVIERIDDYEDIIYISDHIIVNKIFSREDLIYLAKDMFEPRLCRFIQSFPLTDEELSFLAEKRSDTVKKYIEYYQYGDRNAFNR